MRLLISGSRSIRKYALVEEELERINKEEKITTLICGMARGVDTIAYDWAYNNDVPVEEYYPDWDSFGKAAGCIRNKEMLDLGKPDKALVIWDGKSSGTNDMIQLLKKYNIPREIIIINV